MGGDEGEDISQRNRRKWFCNFIRPNVAVIGVRVEFRKVGRVIAAVNGLTCCYRPLITMLELVLLSGFISG